MYLKTLYELFHYSITHYSKNKCFCTLGGDYYTYERFGEKTKEISALLLQNDIQFGDKIGILSQNMPNWAVAFLSCTAYGRVAVPMLPDFTEGEISHILEHSESKALFVSDKLYRKISSQTLDNLKLVIRLDDLTVLKGTAAEPARAGEPFKEPEGGHYIPDEMDLATIIYTSGTTGNSKGVMLTHKNLCSHLHSAQTLRPSFEWDVWLSILPLSHTLECSLSLLLPFSSGSSVYYLEKAPTPTLLLQALKKVRPTTLLVVPLIIEKIYKNSILPRIRAKKITAALYKTTWGRKILHYFIGKELFRMFGGRIRFFGIGGAKLDGTVERFLHEARMPYAIGYGLTECSPLLAGATPNLVKWQTTGPAVPGVKLKILDPDPLTGEGEIVAKGENIMAGYYKNPEATSEAFTPDGWFRTKDLGHIDSKGWLSIRGRLNNMIVGPSGENIYPEEIETVINSHEMVAESIVTSRKGKLVAKVCLNPDKLEVIQKMKEEVFKGYIRKKLALIASYESGKEEFQKEYNQKKEEFVRQYGPKKEGIAHNHGAKTQGLQTAYEIKKQEFSQAYEAKKAELKKAYDQKRRELYAAYARKRDEAVAAYNQKIAEQKETAAAFLESLEREIHEYVNSRVNKFSRLAVVEVSDRQFQKTATHKIKRYLYE